jgi:uncharacterized repeat protein (TIGR03803 family)
VRIHALVCGVILASCSKEGVSSSLPPDRPSLITPGSEIAAHSATSVEQPQVLGGPRDQKIYVFAGGSDGAFPSAGLLGDRSGALYGETANGGGSADAGTVFRLTPAGTGYAETILYSFQGGYDAADPAGGLIADQSGALYGTAGSYSTSSAGTVFKLTPSGSGYTESLIYNFPGGAGGADPQSALVADKHGAFYGTTWEGGISSRNCIVFAAYSCGVVYKLKPAGTGYSESVIYSFQGYPNDGGNPGGALIVSKDGTLYGVTEAGGAGPCSGGYGSKQGCGTVFKLAPSSGGYKESLLYQFQGYYNGDGQSPSGALLVGTDGTFYGTTFSGGRSGSGTVFKLTPAGSTYAEKTIYSFNGIKGRQDGQYPYGVIADAQGSLYGTTGHGGIWGKGTVFKLTLTGKKYIEKLLCQFRDHHDGQEPNGGLIFGSTGGLYGTTIYGGDPGHGTVFKVNE